MALLRHKQRAITAVSPHNANHLYIIPKRGGSITYDYYVDGANGSDSNDGTAPDQAFASLNKIAAGLLTAGEHITVFIASGTYDKLSDYLLVGADTTVAGASMDITFAPGCIMDGTAVSGGGSPRNGMEFSGQSDWSATVYGNGLIVRNYTDAGAPSPNGVGNRNNHYLTVHKVHVDGCEDGFSAHDSSTMITYDCSAINCSKGAFLHTNTATVEHRRCLFEIITTPDNNGSSGDGVSMALVDCVVTVASSAQGFYMGAGSTADRCQLGELTQRLELYGAGGTISNSFVNCYEDGTRPHIYRKCFGFYSVRLRTPGGSDMQDSVIVGPATGQAAVNFSNFDGGGAVALTFGGNVVATSAFQTMDAANAAHLLNGGATFDGNSLWDGAAYDTDLDPSLVSNTITSDPLIGSADSYLMADYASEAGLAGFGPEDVVERNPMRP